MLPNEREILKRTVEGLLALPGVTGLHCICDYGVSLEPVMGPISEWINEQ